MKFSTRCVHGKYKPDYTGTVTVPIYLSSTFAHLGVGKSTGFDYTRSQNPTRLELEKTIAALENGTEALAFSSGMAAISCLFEMYKPGDHFIISADLYGGTIRLFNVISQKNGLTFSAVDTADLEAVKAAITPDTKAIYIETPSNPMMQITDIKKTAELAHAHNIKVIVDNTFLSPYFQQPINLGADFVLHSGTKFLCGHNDVLAGFLITAHEEDAEQLRFLHKTIGACLSPMDSWLLYRGLKTLHLRMEASAKNTEKIAYWLKKHPKVTKVYYPGFSDSLGYEISCQQASGFGAMLSFEVDTEKTARQILESLKLIMFAESLGGTESLITYPLFQTHTDVPKEECLAKGINERLLRLSVGIEDVDDLLEDLEQALK